MGTYYTLRAAQDIRAIRQPLRPRGMRSKTMPLRPGGKRNSCAIRYGPLSSPGTQRKRSS